MTYGVSVAFIFLIKYMVQNVFSSTKRNKLILTAKINYIDSLFLFRIFIKISKSAYHTCRKKSSEQKQQFLQFTMFLFLKTIVFILVI